MVYVNKVCEASYLEDLQSDQFESIWLKLHHPDQVATEPTSEEAATSRPLTIGTLFLGDIRIITVNPLFIGLSTLYLHTTLSST